MNDHEFNQVSKLGEADEEEKDGVSCQLDNLINSNGDLIKQYRNTVEQSRLEFQNAGKRDFDIAVEESLRTFKEEQSQKPLNAAEEEEKAIEESKKEYEQELTERELLDLALKDSLQTAFVGNNQPETQNLNDDEMQRVMAQSLQDFGFDQYLQNPIVQRALNEGFSIEKAVDAMNKMGFDEELVMAYLYGFLH